MPDIKDTPPLPLSGGMEQPEGDGQRGDNDAMAAMAERGLELLEKMNETLEALADKIELGFDN